MRQLTKVISLLWIANFAVYGIVVYWLGGDALNGHSDAGRYYLAMNGHVTEVSRKVFEFSRWYTYGLLAHFAVAFALSVWGWRHAPRRHSSSGV